MSSTVTIVRPTVNCFPIKQLASRCKPLLLVSVRSFLTSFDRVFFIFAEYLQGSLKYHQHSKNVLETSNRFELEYSKKLTLIHTDVLFDNEDAVVSAHIRPKYFTFTIGKKKYTRTATKSIVEANKKKIFYVNFQLNIRRTSTNKNMTMTTTITNQLILFYLYLGGFVYWYYCTSCGLLSVRSCLQLFSYLFFSSLQFSLESRQLDRTWLWFSPPDRAKRSYWLFTNITYYFCTFLFVRVLCRRILIHCFICSFCCFLRYGLFLALFSVANALQASRYFS